MAQLCEHLTNFQLIAANKNYCEECAKTGSRWVHLRVCQNCGTVLCCDSSPNRHASKHARSTGHQVIISAEPGDDWAYCFVHDQITPI